MAPVLFQTTLLLFAARLTSGGIRTSALFSGLISKELGNWPYLVKLSLPTVFAVKTICVCTTNFEIHTLCKPAQELENYDQ